MIAARKTIFTLFFIYILQCLSAQVFPVKYLGIDQGLSNNSVRCIYQDHKGFMWFGTYNGLNRYDGYHFNIFRNKISDSTSLPHNYINAIGEDLHSNLYVGTGQGVSIYNHLTATFHAGLYVPFGSRQKQKISYNINGIKTDGGGNVFLATNGGGLLMVPNGSDVAIQIPCVKDSGGNCRNEIQSMVIDKKQRLWVVAADAGLYRYHPALQKLVLVNNRVKAVRYMAADDNDNLWIATFDNLYQYHISSNSFVEPFREKPLKLTSTSIFSLHYDKQQQLWIGTEGGGINILHTVTGKLIYLLPGEGKNDLSSETVYAIYEDKESRKWIGTHKGGIDIIDPQKRTFQTIAHDPLNTNSPTSNFISSFYHDKNGNLWIGSDGGGISIWNRAENTFTNYRHLPGNQQSLSHNSVPSMLEDYLGTIWIATFGGGINKFNKASGTFEHYKCVNDKTGEENNYVWRLYEDRERNLWATTYSNGRLYRLNRQTDRFEVFSQEFADLFCLMEDQDGTLWAGTAYGVCKLDKQTRTFIHYNITKPVRAIIEDKKGLLWLGTEGQGLIQFNKTKGQVAKSYTDADGLCNNSVLNILEDRRGNFWLSTFHGLSRFDPVAATFKNFYGEDGLQSNQFEYNAALHLQSGEMAFGGISGFTIFHPDSIRVHNSTPPVFITGLRINNQAVTAGSSYITKTDGSSFQQLTIPYDDAVMSVDFTALEYSLPDRISYAYYLENWDKGWNYSGSLRTANYTHLKEGTYLLHIKATNTAGEWNPKEITLAVIVLPPWYRSWWAYLLYASLIAGLIYLYNGYRVRQANLEYRVKLAQLQSEKEKELAQMEIQKEKEMAEKKLALFTGISHEFRTPLTLIINPVKDMLKDKSDAKNGESLKSIYRNAQRLISLTDQLLLFQKANTGEDPLKISRFNFAALCKEVYLYFVQDALSKKIDYQFDCPEELPVYADRQKIEIVLINLLSNAFKYTPVNGRIIMKVEELDEALITTVSDTGTGIQPDVADKIFQRFYQAVDKHSVLKTGFGIGLYLAKSFTEAHKGSISYQSEVGKGTTFRLSLLKGKMHFDDKEILESDPVNEQVANVPAIIGDAQLSGPPKIEELITNDITILVVEDNDQLRAYITGIFSETYKVLQANCAEDGLNLARENLPELIITDVVMQEMSGIDLCKIIKQHASLGHIPVILLTGSLSPESKLQGIEYGADDYITKPFEKDFLVARVANLLKKRTVLQNYFYNEITLHKSNLKVSEEYKTFLETCIAIVEVHLEDETFNVQKLAAATGMSHSKLYKKVKSISGLSVNAFIRYIRLRKAAEFFIRTEMNVNETALRVGINNVKYFREQFNKLFGLNPSEYIRKYRNAFSKGYRINKEALGEDEEAQKQ